VTHCIIAVLLAGAAATQDSRQDDAAAHHVVPHGCGALAKLYGTPLYRTSS